MVRQPMDKNLERLRGAEFTSVQDRVYFNHASLGPLPKRTLEVVRRFNELRSARGSLCVPEYKPALDRARGKLASSIGADRDEIAFIRTTPEGISFVASGIDWREGDNVVTTALEFPANIYPWMNLKRRGVETRIVPTSDGRVPPKEILKAVDHRTRVLSVSWVAFSNGFRLNLDEIGAFCRSRGVYFVVDAIQGLGYLPLDVHTASVDFLASAAHKWMLSPYGVGCFYCRRELLTELALTQVGQNTVVPTERYLTYEFLPKADASRFEAGVPNFGAVAGLEASLDVLAEAGVEKIWSQIRTCTSRLAEGLLTAGYRVLTPLGETESSGIISFSGRNQDATQQVFERLEDSGIVVSLREGAIRVAPHFYNNIDEIDHLLDALN